ncbi:MAG: Bacillolysin [Marmoricola sp.]|nr:Bacillolysin [Marmoricola sp.]
MSRRTRTLRAAAAVAALATASTGAALAVSPAQAAKSPGASSATGTVFYPNPVQSTGDESLSDDDDADTPAFAPAYRQVTLTGLDGSGYLTGPYVTVKSSTGPAAQAVGGAFPAYHRDDDRFEQVMGYYWVDRAQAYLQSLGFGSTYPGVDQRQIELRINQSGHDNSFFRQDQANITLGKGGVDDGEDAEVVVHEYGHSVQDSQVPGFGTSPEAGAMGEGFGDYLAVAVTSWQAGAPTLAPEACVADWDSTSYTAGPTHCLRRLDGTKHYPEDVVGEVHADGEIWSRALWDVRKALGDTRATTTIVDAQFDLAADTTFRTAAQTTVATAQRLYGRSAAAAVTAAFQARGIL